MSHSQYRLPTISEIPGTLKSFVLLNAIIVLSILVFGLCIALRNDTNQAVAETNNFFQDIYVFFSSDIIYQLIIYTPLLTLLLSKTQISPSYYFVAAILYYAIAYVTKISIPMSVYENVDKMGNNVGQITAATPDTFNKLTTFRTSTYNLLRTASVSTGAVAIVTYLIYVGNY